MDKNQNKEQLSLLTEGDILDLLQVKQRLKIQKAGGPTAGLVNQTRSLTT